MSYDPVFLSVHVRIEQRGPRGGNRGQIALSEEAEFRNLSLVELAQILEQFHALIEALQARRMAIPAPVVGDGA